MWVFASSTEHCTEGSSQGIQIRNTCVCTHFYVTCLQMRKRCKIIFVSSQHDLVYEKQMKRQKDQFHVPTLAVNRPL